MRKDRFLFELMLLALTLCLIAAACQESGRTFKDHGGKIRSGDMARELTAKSNLRLIKTALERYATDHDGEYPKYIWGGDEQGWKHYYAPSMQNGTGRAIRDPLIAFGYLDEYPENPFVRNGESVVIQTAASGSEKPGCGDPRFGFRGTRMGNGISDPRFPEADQTLGGLIGEKWGGGSSMTIGTDPGRTYTMAGWYQEKKKENVSSHWPGNFFYRAGGELKFEGAPPDTDALAGYGYPTSGRMREDAKLIVSIPRTDRYVLGAFGAPARMGFDVLRMGDPETDEGGVAFLGVMGAKVTNYKVSSDEDGKWPIMFPEAMGGGDDRSAPRWPYTHPESGEWIYCSPDGSPDGVILVVRDREDKPLAGRW